MGFLKVLNQMYFFICQTSFPLLYFIQGNQSRAFLKKVDSLQLALEQESDEVLLNGLPFVHAFRSFSCVVHSCFGVDLKDRYEEKIDEFKKCYLALDITVTPKVI